MSDTDSSRFGLFRCPRCYYFATTRRIMGDHGVEAHGEVWSDERIAELADSHAQSAASRHDEDGDVIFRHWKYGRDGQKLYAADYGRKAWALRRCS